MCLYSNRCRVPRPDRLLSGVAHRCWSRLLRCLAAVPTHSVHVHGKDPGHPRWLRWRQATAGPHDRRLTNFVCAIFFPDRGVRSHAFLSQRLCPSPVDTLPVQAIPSSVVFSSPAPRFERTSRCSAESAYAPHWRCKLLGRAFHWHRGKHTQWRKTPAGRHGFPPAPAGAILPAEGRSTTGSTARL